MTRIKKYGKPNMTNLPKDLGTRIFRTIRSTPAPDWAKMEQEADELERQMLLEREKHRKNSATLID